MTDGTSSSRRFDPDRRDRIIDAALDVIAEHGVAGTTHRRVAAAAGVPLGSMTYHFEGIEQLLVEAFTRLCASVSARFAALLDAASTPDEAREAVVEIIVGNVWATPRILLLTYELYAYAARHEAVKPLVHDWFGQSHAALARHFGPLQARAVDALIEGLGIHNSVDREPMGRDEVRAIVDRLTIGTPR